MLTKLSIKPAVQKRVNLLSPVEIIAGALLVCGLALRIGQFAAMGSLTYDEAMLALNLMRRSFAGLLEPLGLNQGAPLGFLFLAKAVLRQFGAWDYLLKLLPQLAACASLFLFYRLARRHFPPLAVLVGLGLFVVSEPLIFYSIIFKQYAGDVLICLALLILAAGQLEAGLDRKSLVLWGLASAAAIWFSHPALFVVAGVSLVLAARCATQRQWKDLLHLVLASLGWAASLAFLYITSLQDLAANQALLSFWQAGFMPLPPWKDLGWFARAAEELILATLYRAYTWPCAALLALGLFSLYRRNRFLAWLFILPALLALLASGIQKYPFAGRMLLFLAPVTALLVGEGVDYLYGRLSGFKRLSVSILVLLIAVLLVRPALSAGKDLLYPRYIEHLRPAMQYLRDHKQYKDPIYVYYGAWPAFLFYAPQFGLRANQYTLGVTARNNPEQYQVDLQKWMGEKRLWLVFTHVYQKDLRVPGTNEEVIILKQLDRTGKRLQEFHSPDASVYLYRPARKTSQP